ncbi:MAG: MarR family transcriptional regulator [Phycisphaerales bacterium]|nr:MAG: MarR family transcriptional regulator [Phycisphaerales bacterium]
MKQQRQGGFLIAKIHQVAGRVFARKLKEHRIREINPAQGRILFVLWREDGIAMNELARRSGLGKSTLTSMLDRLEEAGYVTRVPSREDRRQFLIRRTEKDKALERVYVEVSQEMAGVFYKGFSSGEIDRFERYLQRILDNLTEAEAGGD